MTTFLALVHLISVTGFGGPDGSGAIVSNEAATICRIFEGLVPSSDPTAAPPGAGAGGGEADNDAAAARRVPACRTGLRGRPRSLSARDSDSDVDGSGASGGPPSPPRPVLRRYDGLPAGPSRLCAEDFSRLGALSAFAQLRPGFSFPRPAHCFCTSP